MPGKRSTKRNADCGDFVFGLQSSHAEMFVLGEFVQNVTCRCDWVRPKREWQVGLLGGSDEPP